MSGITFHYRAAVCALFLAGAALSGWGLSPAIAAPPPPAAPPPAKAPPPVQNPPAQNPPAQPPTAAQVGRALFFDTTMSTPSGMACAMCHAPQTGWTYPVSSINQALGVAPGVVSGRYGNRRVPTIGYQALLPSGPPVFVQAKFGYVGGFFYDGRAATLAAQAALPLQNPNEMNDDIHGVGSPALVVQNLQKSPNAALFRQLYGSAVFAQPTATVLSDLTHAIAAFEGTSEVSPFSSRYDAYLAGRIGLAPNEMNGLRLFTGTTNGRPGGTAFTKNAQCSVCHELAATTGARDLFTGSVFVNTGVPKNPNNPFYKQTNAAADPVGFNPLGAAYIDYGLGDFLYPNFGLPSGNTGSGANGQGDYLKINGVFKTSTLRNVDKRPSPGFVKAYTHNGYFKSLKQIVHFYNMRNLTTKPGEVIDFTRANPYAGLKGTPLFPAPENLNPATLVNPTGATPANGGLVGNLGLSDQEENDIVSFLQTLSDAP
jgi:cytochrome c peroxidase